MLKGFSFSIFILKTKSYAPTLLQKRYFIKKIQPFARIFNPFNIFYAKNQYYLVSRCKLETKNSGFNR